MAQASFGEVGAPRKWLSTVTWSVEPPLDEEAQTYWLNRQLRQGKASQRRAGCEERGHRQYAPHAVLLVPGALTRAHQLLRETSESARVSRAELRKGRRTLQLIVETSFLRTRRPRLVKSSAWDETPSGSAQPHLSALKDSHSWLLWQCGSVQPGLEKQCQTQLREEISRVSARPSVGQWV